MQFWRILLFVAMGVPLAGCALDDAGPVHSVFRAEPAKPIFSDVFFVTDRLADPAAGGGFGTRWAAKPSCGRALAVVPAAPRDGKTVWGYVDHTIPVSCTAGRDPLGGVVAAMAAQARLRNCRSVFLFVHGFHTGFDGAVLRAAQIAHDAQSGCVAAAFSWTSEIKLDRYTVDQERSAFAQPLLTAFLRELAEAGLDVQILGHSMGARVALTALGGLSMEREPPSSFVSQLVLAAPDIGVGAGNDDFLGLLSLAAPFVTRTTVYVSGNDAVLAASQSAHGGVPRLGQSMDEGTRIPPTMRTVDIVDATPVPADALGHGYFSMSYETIYDLTQVLRGVALEDRLHPASGWPATIVAGNAGTALMTDRRPRLITRIMVALTPLLP